MDYLPDSYKRVLHTFWQAFAVVFFGGLLNIAHTFGQSGLTGAKSALLALLLAAAAAGLSAVKNWFISLH